ncbi:MAG: hypothetical protein AAGN46_12890 [Acidobacteriota bacterium]
MISTRDLSELPDLDALRRLNCAQAALDAILCPEWEFRYFSFHPQWGENQQLALMRNGEGDDVLVVHHPAGALLKGFAHEAPMAAQRPWPGLFADLPAPLRDLLEDEALSTDATTFCCWRLRDAATWQTATVETPPGDDPDGSRGLLVLFDGRPETYRRWADNYYGRPLDAEAVAAVYAHRPLDSALVRRLHPGVDVEEVRREVAEIGYPVS